MKSGLGITGALALFFIAWIFLASLNEERIERACSPFVWTGNIFTSITSLVSRDSQETVQEVFEDGDYACRFVIWRLFFEEEYLKEIERQQKLNEAAAQDWGDQGEAPGFKEEPVDKNRIKQVMDDPQGSGGVILE